MDHNVLCCLAGIKAHSEKLEIWALQLQEYNYEIVYCCGSKRVDADALSCSPFVHSTIEEVLEYLPLAVLDTVDMVKEQSFDLFITKPSFPSIILWRSHRESVILFGIISVVL